MVVVGSALMVALNGLSAGLSIALAIILRRRAIKMAIPIVH